MSVYSAIKTFIATYTGLESGAPLTSDYEGASPTWYAIVPQAGPEILETDVLGNTVRQFPFAFQSMRYVADEYERLESIDFYENFTAWLESKTKAGTLPTLATGKTADTIETTGRPFLLQVTLSDVGIYTIPCRLIYLQAY